MTEPAAPQPSEGTAPPVAGSMPAPVKFGAFTGVFTPGLGATLAPGTRGLRDIDTQKRIVPIVPGGVRHSDDGAHGHPHNHGRHKSIVLERP